MLNRLPFCFNGQTNCLCQSFPLVQRIYFVWICINISNQLLLIQILAHLRESCSPTILHPYVPSGEMGPLMKASWRPTLQLKGHAEISMNLRHFNPKSSSRERGRPASICFPFADSIDLERYAWLRFTWGGEDTFTYFTTLSTVFRRVAYSKQVPLKTTQQDSLQTHR